MGKAPRLGRIGSRFAARQVRARCSARVCPADVRARVRVRRTGWMPRESVLKDADGFDNIADFFRDVRPMQDAPQDFRFKAKTIGGANVTSTSFVEAAPRTAPAAEQPKQKQQKVRDEQPAVADDAEPIALSASDAPRQAVAVARGDAAKQPRVRGPVSAVRRLFMALVVLTSVACADCRASP